MTAHPFTQPDNTSQDGTSYKNNLDNAIAMMNRIAGGFAPQAQDTPNMTVQIGAGFIPAVGALPTEVVAQNSSAITAPSTNPRKDIVYIDQATGTIGVATGTEAASPSDPSISADKVAIARINLTTSTTEITNADLDDIRNLQFLGLLEAALTFSGNNTFSGANTHSGNNTFSGTNSFSDTLTASSSLNVTGKLRTVRDASTLTIATGAITATDSFHMVDTESSAATDDLDTINGGVSGYQLVLRILTDARNVVIKHNTGNILTPDGEDITLDTNEEIITLVYDDGHAAWLVKSQGNTASKSYVDNLLDVTKSLGTNGYLTLIGDVILQWGRYTGGANGVSVSFPTTFTTVYAALAVANDSANQAEFVTVTNISTTQISVDQFDRNTGNPGTNFYWFAIGV
jgi:hypothetical protein